MTTVGAYCRVSTDEQARESFSIGAQKDRLLSFCQSQGWAVADIYSDEAHFGDNLGIMRNHIDGQGRRVRIIDTWRRGTT